MGEGKHTPGPWRFSSFGSNNNWLEGPDDETIFHFNPYGNRAPSDANARMIAAAPEQHAAGVALDRLLLIIESAVRTADPEHHQTVLAALKANRAAIAKALPSALAGTPS